MKIKNKKSIFKIILLVISVIIVLCVAGFMCYVSIYYKADEVAEAVYQEG